MKTFELTTQNGEIKIIRSNGWGHLSIGEDVVKVEIIDSRIIAAQVNAANDAFSRFGKSYHPFEACKELAIQTLNNNGFHGDVLNNVLTLDRLEVRCQPIGRNVFVAISLYQMPTGVYEFVGYVG